MKKTKIYAEVLEDEALEQFESAMAEPFAVQWALMPDAHTWYSLPIWAVVATKWVIVPAWVWYDIGCWMSALKLDIKKDELKWHKDTIFNKIYEKIPVWFNKHEEAVNVKYPEWSITETTAKLLKERGRKQIWTLWWGNHFIEIWYDEDENVWIIIHSWSRWFWHWIASHYMKLASWDWKAREWHFWFDVNSQNWKDYIRDMKCALDFAILNRFLMICVVEDIICESTSNKLKNHNELFRDMNTDEYEWIYINRNHNHAEEKDWLWIHRKWATHAEKWMMWVIPWNMRDWSFIVKWKWCEDSLCSSSHWAWRILWRKAAKKALNLDDFKETMKWITAKVCEETKDESPEAYKNIFDVMKQQDDLVEVVAHITPLINIKA